VTANARDEIQAGARFGFGENWSNFLRTLTDERVREAETSLKSMLGVNDLAGKDFIDVGSGSGLFSLAARRLGARVHSFDFDPMSVACATELKKRYFRGDDKWVIQQGSALDPAYLAGLGQFDVAYSWGVLHHTGAMWDALANVVPLVRPGGTLFVAIYNHMGGATRRWIWIKKTYCSAPHWLRKPIAAAVIAPIYVYSFFVYLLQGKIGRFLKDAFGYGRTRGMSWWHDQLDWIGGYPYEDAKPEEIFAFYRQRGFHLENMTTWGGGIGCNEFVFSLPVEPPATSPKPDQP
jgi:2-polyprenyl-3-methyl-5-hydroxy-6-metoxy-1,4-benzoquinol methylase